MGTAYRKEPTIEMIAEEEDVFEGICGDPTRCTLAHMGLRYLGAVMEVVYDEDTGHVRCVWTVDGRYHKGILTPNNNAVRLLLLTDTNKKKLLRQVREKGPVPLVLEDHWSRNSQKEPTEEQKEAKRFRQRELEKNRALGIEPPPLTRKPSPGGRVCPTSGARFHEPVKATSAVS